MRCINVCTLQYNPSQPRGAAMSTKSGEIPLGHKATANMFAKLAQYDLQIHQSSCDKSFGPFQTARFRGTSYRDTYLAAVCVMVRRGRLLSCWQYSYQFYMFENHLSCRANHILKYMATRKDSTIKTTLNNIQGEVCRRRWRSRSVPNVHSNLLLLWLL